MNYTEQIQQSFYNQRIGTVYGCFEVTDVKYDPEQKRQLWTLRCVHCGLVKQTYNGKDYAKGKNHGICKCQHTKKLYSGKPQKNKKAIMKDHPLYSRWERMKSRCYRKSDKDYHNYGGRGITMCDEWRYDFWAFVDWAMENGYRKGLTIDRRDNDKGYSPENCHWITRYEQNQNKRNISLYDGMTLPDWCLEHDVSYATMATALRKGMAFEEAVKIATEKQKIVDFNETCKAFGVDPITIKRRMAKGLTFQEAVDFKGKLGTKMYEMDGVQKPLSEWCAEYGITVPAVEYRMKKKAMSFQEALTTPKAPGSKIRKK